MTTYLLAVNGTLMRGLSLNANLLRVGATFVEETTTDAHYRSWNVNDDHPGMIREEGKGGPITVEIWAVPADGLGALLQQEPAGLTMGKVRLMDGREVLGILAEPWSVVGQDEITAYGGWREYWAQR